MIPKVKMNMVQDGDYITYTIQSKSLTAALQRATLLTEAIGLDHEVELEHNIIQTKRNKIRQQILVHVS